MTALLKRLLPLLMLSGHIGTAQTPPTRDPSHYSRAQLQACYDNLNLCGAKDIYAIDDELVSRLPTLPISTLVRCYSNWRICGAADSQASGWEISDELAHRGDANQIFSRYGNTPNRAIRAGLEHLAYQSDSPQAQAFMKRAFAKSLDDGERLYWPAKYLAAQCDPAALRFLAHHSRSFSISSLELSDSTELFGNCHYRPAIPFLVGYALQAASLNLVDAADTSLRVLYPSAPKFSSLEEEQHWFCRTAKKDGYRVDCDGAAKPVTSEIENNRLLTPSTSQPHLSYS